MNNDLPHRADAGRRGRQQVQSEGQEQLRIVNDREKLGCKVEELNERAVICISTQKCEQALVYLQEAEQLLEAAASKGYSSHRHTVQCILHNQATCYQNLWQLDQCSNYIEALIFNLNSAKGQFAYNRQNVVGLSQYYLQFCAVNSQLGNHSGALISARKSLNLMKGQLREWKRLVQLSHKDSKGENEEKIRLLNLICRLNDNINISQLDLFQQAVGYYVKNWKVTASKSKFINKEMKEFIQGFTMKSIMTLQKMNYEDCIRKYEKESDMSLLQIYKRILVLSSCYFTIATQLRLISLKKQRENEGQLDRPEYKQSEIYHLLAVLLLVFTVSLPSPFITQLINSFRNNYGKDIEKNDLQFKKIYSQITFIHQVRNRQTSISNSEHEEALGSYLSKGSATMIRRTKGSKESDRHNKLSQIEPKRKIKLKDKKTKSKPKKEEIKKKHPIQSIVKTSSKESILPHSQKSKHSLPKRSPIPSIKLIPHKDKTKSLLKQKGGKKGAKCLQKRNEYFLLKQGKGKKQSLSTKKNTCSSTGKLPIDSTIQAKNTIGNKDKKKEAKKSILQYYL